MSITNYHLPPRNEVRFPHSTWHWHRLHSESTHSLCQFDLKKKIVSFFTRLYHTIIAEVNIPETTAENSCWVTATSTFAALWRFWILFSFTCSWISPDSGYAKASFKFAPKHKIEITIRDFILCNVSQTSVFCKTRISTQTQHNLPTMSMRLKWLRLKLHLRYPRTVKTGCEMSHWPTQLCLKKVPTTKLIVKMFFLSNIQFRMYNSLKIFSRSYTFSYKNIARVHVC